MDWRWTARRLLISLFLLGHVGATTIWVLPECPIRRCSIAWIDLYITPLGLWQYWTMFAPDPVRDSLALEAEIVDARGLRYKHAFPRLRDYTTWEGLPRYRHSKYAANLGAGSLEKPREFAARHAVREMNVPAEAFPVEVTLGYDVTMTPPVGEPPVTRTSPTRFQPFATYHFATLSEVRP